MAECTRCPFCAGEASGPGTLERTRDTARVPAIIREFGQESFTVWRCPSCRSLHCREDVDLDAYYRVYPFAGQQMDFWTRIAYRNKLKWLEREGLKKDDAILDFGCAGGLFVEFLRAQGYERAVGYDAYVPRFSDPAVLAAPYAAVLAQDVIEHADDPGAMLAQLAGCLAPGGLLYLGTPLADRIRLADPAAFAMSLHQPYHRHIFSRAALVRAAQGVGLVAVRIRERHSMDTWVPTVNARFLHEFVRRSGNVVNAAFEPPRPGILRRHPRLLVFAFFGYLFSHRCEVSAFFRKSA